MYLAPIPRVGDLPGIYGCAHGSGRAYLIGEELPEVGSSGGISGVATDTLSGSMVAYEFLNAGPTGADWEVEVRNLRNGRVVYSSPTGTPSLPSKEGENGLKRTYSGIGATTAIVVKEDGSVAWIVKTTAERGGYQVHALDKTGSRTLATGTDIAPESLALAGSTLYWTQGGTAESATLN